MGVALRKKLTYVTKINQSISYYKNDKKKLTRQIIAAYF